MSLRTKIVAILIASGAAIFVADAAIERFVVLPKFVVLERREAELNLRRVEQALDRELDQLARTAKNYAEWDDACRFLETRSPEFLQSNLAPEVFAMLRLSLVHYYDREGKLVWGESRNANDGAATAIPGLNPADIAPGVLLGGIGETASVHGLLAAGNGVMLVASNPILTSRGKGPARGAVVFGRLLTADALQGLREQTSVAFAMTPVDDGQALPPDSPATEAETVGFDESRRDVLVARRTLCDVHGRALRVLQVELPRQITAQGRAVVFDENLWMLIAILASVLAVYLGFGRMVIRPVRQLIRHIQWIRQSGDLSNRIGLSGGDEVGTLAREFDLMLAQLARSQAARARSERQFKTVLQDHPDLIWRFTPDGTTVFVNRAYARYFGVAEERLIGRKEAMPIVEDDRACVEAHWKALSRACPETEVEHRVRLADGEVRWLHWKTRAVFDPDGEVVEIQSVGRDITRQKQGAASGAAAVPVFRAPVIAESVPTADFPLV